SGDNRGVRGRFERLAGNERGDCRRFADGLWWRKFDCGSYSFLKLGGSFAVGRQRFIGSERLEDEFREVTRLEFTASEDENEVLCRPNVNALTAASNGFEHPGIVLAFHPPRVAVM